MRGLIPLAVERVGLLMVSERYIVSPYLEDVGCVGWINLCYICYPNVSRIGFLPSEKSRCLQAFYSKRKVVVYGSLSSCKLAQPTTTHNGNKRNLANKCLGPLKLDRNFGDDFRDYQTV